MRAAFDLWRIWRATISALTIALLLTPLALAQRAGRRGPNIIFIQADDLGYGDLSCYGQKKFSTPRLDRLAAEGIRFTQYYAGSTVCAPSRASLMTGFHTGHGYIRGNGDYPLRPEDVTVAEVLKAAGYSTAVIGKWGLGTAATAGRPDRQGFDESFGFLDHTHAHRQYTSHLWKNGAVFAVDPEKDYVNDLFTRAALDFIGRHQDRPFFLYLSFTAPHAELRAPEEAMREHRGKYPETPFVNARADAVEAATPSRDRQPSIGYRSQPTPQAAYAAMITRMDGHVGEILERLKERGLDGRTIVFFTSDNGPHKEGGVRPDYFDSNGPLRGLKRDLYEGGIRVPMIVRWPGRIKAGATSDQAWAHWDFLPTAADLAGARSPAGIDGISMLPTLLGRRQKGHRFFYWEFYEQGFSQAARMGNWKAVRTRPDRALELYDLKADTGEHNDVSAKHPLIVKKIEEYLKTARTESEIWKIAKSR